MDERSKSSRLYGVPGEDHEEAIATIAELLALEFSLPVASLDTVGIFFPMSLRPDISFVKPGTNQYIVVEVGDTQPGKIDKYVKSKKVCEIRWYTRLKHHSEIVLVGKWDVKNFPAVRVTGQTYGAIKAKREIRRNEEEFKKDLKEKKLSFDSFVCCTGCGHHVKIADLRIIHHYGREYGVCSSCHSAGRFNTCNEIEAMIAFYERQFQGKVG